MPEDGRGMDGEVPRVARTRPFSIERIDFAVPSWGTLAKIVYVAGVDPINRPNTHVFIGDIEISREK